MAKVFIIQNQRHYSKEEDKLVSRFNFEPAKQYGELNYLLSPTAAPFYATSIVKELHEKLKHIQEDDSLLLVGNPILIGLATAVASEYVDNINFLQWSGKHQKYIQIPVELRY